MVFVPVGRAPLYVPAAMVRLPVRLPVPVTVSAPPSTTLRGAELVWPFRFRVNALLIVTAVVSLLRV